MARTIKNIVVDLEDVLNDIDAHNAALKPLKEQKEELEQELRDALKAQGVESAGTMSYTYRIDRKVVAQVIDWDQFWDYVYAEEAGHLLERRVTQKPYRELLDKGITPPGTEPFTKETIARHKKG